MPVTIGQIRYDLFQINESDDHGLNVDAYLILGNEKALLVDTLQDTEELCAKVRSITDKPVEAVIAHGHPDHAGKGMKQLHEAGIPLWIAEEDIPLYTGLFGGEYPSSWFSVLKNGQVFDLGSLKLETIYLPGHTPGSIVLFDEKEQRLFSSDAVGSGHFWMQIPGCIPLHEFREYLAKLTARMESFPDLRIYPGHRYQSDQQLNLQYLRDTLHLTDRILKGEDHGKDKEMLFAGSPLHYRECAYGMMKGYCYNPDNL